MCREWSLLIHSISQLFRKVNFGYHIVVQLALAAYLKHQHAKMLHIKKHQSEVGETSSYTSNRTLDSIIPLLIIGLTYMTHEYLLTGKLAPKYIPCNKPPTVKHMLLDCINLAFVLCTSRQKHTICPLKKREENRKWK